MGGVRLSGTFQPNVVFDFGEGKIFSNKFAESLRPFSLTTGTEKVDDEITGEYVYEYVGGSFVKTDEVCPRCAMNIGGRESNNIKVKLGKHIILEEGKGVKLMTHGGIEEDVAYRPSVICMPQYAPITRNNNVYPSDGVRPIDGELYTVVVEPDLYVLQEIYKPNWYENKMDVLFRRASVLLCADKRRFKTESYNIESETYCPEGDYIEDSGNPKYDEDERNEIRFKFKVGSEYCDFIYLGVGSMVKLRSVVEIDEDNRTNVYWVVENRHVLTPLDCTIYIETEIGEEFFQFEISPKVYGSRILSFGDLKGEGDFHYRLSDDTDKDWRDRVIDYYAYDDIKSNSI